jgi:multidrug resistance efflux pump
MTDLPARPVVEVETVPRQRYEDAVDEIDHLRLALKEAEKGQKRAEAVTEEAREAADRERERAEKAIAHLERLLELLS